MFSLMNDTFERKREKEKERFEKILFASYIRLLAKELIVVKKGVDGTTDGDRVPPFFRQKSPNHFRRG